MKRILTFVFSIVLVLSLTACGTGSNGGESSSSSEKTTEEQIEENMTESTEENSPEEESVSNSDNPGTSEEEKTLVVVFSATGTTKGVAEKIAVIEGADFYEIIAEEPYSDDDLNWSDSNSRTTKEQNDDSIRPGIASESIDLSTYSKIYIGYPIWWGEEPRIMDTFVESYDFGSITMIPFCTSTSSGMGRSGKNLAENAGSGNWLDGARFGGSASEDEISSWIEGMK